MGKYPSKKGLSEQDRREFDAVEDYLKTAGDDAFRKVMASRPKLAAKAKKIRESRCR